jgi:hypothetical protein
MLRSVHNNARGREYVTRAREMQVNELNLVQKRAQNNKHY